MDALEKDICNLFNKSGPLDRDEVTVLLLQLLDRIQKLEAIKYLAKAIGELQKQVAQQRTWVGLTSAEWSDLYEAHHDKYNQPKQGSPDGMDYERAIEAKLKEKNT